MNHTGGPANARLEAPGVGECPHPLAVRVSVTDGARPVVEMLRGQPAEVRESALVGFEKLVQVLDS